MNDCVSRRWCTPVARACLALGLLLMATAAHAQLQQPDGSVIPTVGQLDGILNRAPLNEGIDIRGDASLVPEVFTPADRLTFSFIAEGAGYENAFGWYNLGDDVSNPANRHVIFECDVEPQQPYVTRTVDFCGNPDWRGGPIGFFLITPELVGGGTRRPNCAVNDNQGYIYYSEPRLNTFEDADNPYIHHVVYRSNTFPDAFYFGFEDLFRGGDNDFEDALVLVEGLLVGDAPEACNGEDDDCDGRIDEGADAVCETECGVGVRACVDGLSQACTAPEPGEEACNGADDDCDGTIDEGLSRACENACGAGVEVCIAGQYGGCTAQQPAEESCNNVDDDCDGTIDEGLRIACQNACGVAGEARCVAGSYVECDAPQPVAEVCNGLDDDCDGLPDEQLVEVCESECGRGLARCEDGVFVGCSAPEPGEEVCNGGDDDCDGTVDEALTRPCESVCGEVGEERCVGGSWVACSGRQPSAEACNGVDDDCDGETDEELVRDCQNACGAGTQLCVDGAWSPCDAPDPVPEQCDGVDQDCDGNLDEGLIQACRSACGEGVRRCILGEYNPCDAPEPSDETCDGTDEDCDGAIDEGLEQPCGSGCGIGTEICIEGEWVGCTAADPQPEACNGLDDDCDGSLDENLMRDCRTPCGMGVQACEAGRWTACPAPEASEEVCNGQDDDCDGITDEGAECADGSCVRGVCALPCQNLECPPGQMCEEGFCVPLPCQDCRPFEVCRADACVDPCAGVECLANEYCLSGECTIGDCFEGGCDAGKVCIGGECVPDDCALVICGAGQGCNLGACFDTCLGVVCADDERCVAGACNPDPCAGVGCGDGGRCREGACEDDPCAGVECDAGQVCGDGACGDDPCLTTTCPDGSICAVDDMGRIDCVFGSEEGDEVEGSDGDVPPVPTDMGLPDGGGGTGGGTGGGDCSTVPGTTPSGGGLLLLMGLLVLGFTGRRSRARMALVAAALSLAGCPAATDVEPGETEGAGGASFDGCLPTTEVCNGVDDDCDGIVDNVDNLDSDPLNCGACGSACLIDNAQPVCIGGNCRILRCSPGFQNDDGLAGNGCESVCEPTGDEVCNGVDDDCDGAPDEGFDLGRDPENCGVCGRSCLVNGVTDAMCLSGRCVISACSEGRINLDGLAENGCEYACAGVGAEEICNGEDDDCDGTADENLTAPMDCLTEGLCAGARAECRGVEGYQCTYPDGVTLDGETRCDGLDEDCDGNIDEDFGVLGDACDGDDDDLCPNGLVVCDPDRTGTICREVVRAREQCDGEDNDCDGDIDEGFDLQGDASHCGRCGNDCSALNAIGACEAGQCEVLGCRGEFVDLDGDPATGCEYPCQVDGDGTEVCNGADDDCDGRIDEDVVPPPEAECPQIGVCAGSVALCQGPAGFACAFSADYEPDGETRCDGQDNDCDGTVDEDFPLVGELCDGADDDLCLGGVVACAADGQGTQCTDDLAAIDEICDGADNDCDGGLDEGFDLEGDPTNCGACGNRCERPNAETDCEDAGCVLTACEPGWFDANQLPIDGCEYACAADPADEICNGEDDDCDGRVDEGVQPPAELRCDRPGVCAGLQPVCAGAAGFECPFPAVYEVAETRCDGLDNDCDGQIDEARDNPDLAGVGEPCSAGQGACLGRGVTVCTDDGTGARCTASAGEPAEAEACNGVDDDCDGTTDEGIARGDEMVRFDVGGRQVWIDRWEASRPDATAEAPGLNTDRACSTEGVVPWANVTQEQAAAACAARGKRLCTNVEWGAACGSIYPYGDDYNADRCVTGQDAPQVTGAANCASPSGAVDMSGNLAEWTDCAEAVDCQVVVPLLGGSYADRVEAIWRCDFRGNGVPGSATATAGFRCCQDD